LVLNAEVYWVRFLLRFAGSLSDEEVKFEFKKRISKQAKDLLTDVQNFS
jgi:hypothetical protein